MDNIISNTELCVLQYFWKSNEPQSFSQIFEYFNTTGGKDGLSLFALGGCCVFRVIAYLQIVETDDQKNEQWNCCV